MKLFKVEIEGYRSIRTRMVIHIEPNVTVVLGPNDHGKTNLLHALRHLNTDAPFDIETDLNWDSHGDKSTCPSVVATFILSTEELQWLLTEENACRDRLNQRFRITLDLSSGERTSELQPDEGISQPADGLSDADRMQMEEDGETPTAIMDEQTLVNLRMIPSIIIKRIGIEGKLEYESSSGLNRGVLKRFASQFAPRIEIIDPMTALSDSVSATDLTPGTNDFMRGIFYYAGLDPIASSTLFEQSDVSQMRLQTASEQLDATLRNTWSQGQDLHFALRHDSQRSTIDLLIRDPSVKDRFVRASRRSSGFTHYFSLKTILHARQRDHQAASYVWLFDEPGIFLHPSGQYDLLQVLETLSQENQVLYATHSLFMINKTFPSRHRLLMKDRDGTKIDGKPYVGRWQAALSSLGLTLTGSILFANNVLLTEGDSDPIYIYAIVQKAVAAKQSQLNLNGLGVMSTSESVNAEVLLRLFIETTPKPKIAVLFDGDEGGKERRKKLQPLMATHDINSKILTDGTEIEDHLPMLRELFVPAVAGYVGKLMVYKGEAQPDESMFTAKFLEHFNKSFPDEKGAPIGVMNWVESVAREFGKMDSAPSKVGIARDYAAKLAEIPNDTFILGERAKALLDWLHAEAGIPDIRPLEKRILAGA